MEEEIEEEAGRGPSSPETNSMAGRVRVCSEGRHFLNEVRRGGGERRKPTFDVDLDTDLWRAARGIGMQSPQKKEKTTKKTQQKTHEKKTKKNMNIPKMQNGKNKNVSFEDLENFQIFNF